MLADWQAGHLPGHYLPHVDPETGKTTDCSRWGTGSSPAPARPSTWTSATARSCAFSSSSPATSSDPRRSASEPRRRRCCRSAPPSRLTKSSGRWWGLPGDNWQALDYAPHRVEVLGNGQQFVAYARHPRGTWYRWRHGEPMDTLPDRPPGDRPGRRQGLPRGRRTDHRRRRRRAAAQASRPLAARLLQVTTATAISPTTTSSARLRAHRSGRSSLPGESSIRSTSRSPSIPKAPTGPRTAGRANARSIRASATPRSASPPATTAS